jgi:hypothetical protein
MQASNSFELRSPEFSRSPTASRPDIFANIVLCIPKVSVSVTIEYIRSVIEKMMLGNILSIQELCLRSNMHYKRIIIKLNWDLSTLQANRVYNTLHENKSIKIVHSMPWYWICVKYVKQSTINSQQKGPDKSLMTSILCN